MLGTLAGISIAFISMRPAFLGSLSATAVPLGIYNFTEGMNNVESAAAAGDDYSLRQILLADGAGAIVGALLGRTLTSF
jgi:AGZA family xanthine/uracil permease-like MFS transporter